MQLSSSNNQKQKTKSMIIPKVITKVRLNRLALGASVLVLAVASFAAPHFVAAQSLQQQINELNRQNQQTQAEVSDLAVEAANFEETIAALQAEINTLQAEIKANEKKRDELAAQIQQKTEELEYQRDVIGQSIRAQYMEGNISTIEMLATSKNLSDYLDKQQYRTSVQNKIKKTLEEIRVIRAELDEQKQLREKLLESQQAMRSQLSAQQAEQNRLLALNQAERSALDGRIKANNTRIAELRRQQAIENARLWSNGRVMNIPDTTGYPWANVQPFPNAFPDPWGMYKRQCVSYAAWKVWKDGKHMPYWGGRGNAKNWANNARAAGIPVYRTPQRGDIAVSTRGTYGHVMYVEEVYGNGTMRISQYNGSWDGRYSEAVISTAGLEYVRFQ